ncbi:Oxidoreductase, aldo/keto reductase family protein [Aphelenchoides fujianensis]|nr:Oxidoreductase, aldo/keto reductase family protein [Aphelenchoides fujianensis]
MTIDVGRIQQSNGTQLPPFWAWHVVGQKPGRIEDGALRAALEAGYRKFSPLYRHGRCVRERRGDWRRASRILRCWEIEARGRVDQLRSFPISPTSKRRPKRCSARSLKALRTSYLDLYLIHAPIPMKPKEDLSGPETDENDKQIPLDIPLSRNVAQYEEGVFRSIGISNFHARQIEELCEQAKIPPHNLQVELHILWPQHELLRLCREKGISVTSYSVVPSIRFNLIKQSVQTLGSPGRKKSSVPFHEGDCLGHPDKTPAQILLRHTIQQGISVVPKSTHANRVRENIDIFDFEITAEDQRKLFDIHERARAAHHPQYPFRDTCALGAYDHEELKTALRAALNAGYRYVDTAAGYGNEEAIGDVLQEFYEAGTLKREASKISQYVPGDCMGHAIVQQLAAKYAKTPAQILLRHTIQQGISVIPKSTSPQRLRENIDIFDFEISAEDQEKLHAIDEKEHVRLLVFNFAEHHPNYPFRDPY